MLPLLSNYKRHLTSMLLNKQSTRGSQTPSSRKMLLPSANLGASAVGSKSPKTSKTMRNLFPSSNFSPSAFVPGIMSMQGQPINKKSVDQYLLSIDQILASVGANNPQHNRVGKLNFRLGRQLASYQKENSPPTRVCLSPVSIIQALYTAAQRITPRNIVISNLTWVANFVLLLPGKYCRGGTDTAQHPFRIKDVKLIIV